jgi:ATP-dependent Clp protease ATP-binding subunit ClpA
MFERFTDRARRVVVLGQEEARLLNHNYIGTEHILLGLIREGDGVGAKALESLGISLQAVRAQVEEIIGHGGSSPSGHIPFTPRAKKVLELSLREALQLGHDYIGSEHILLGLIREGEGVAATVLVTLGADLSRVRQQVIQMQAGHSGPALSALQLRSTALLEGSGGPHLPPPDEVTESWRYVERLVRSEEMRIYTVDALLACWNDDPERMRDMLGRLWTLASAVHDRVQLATLLQLVEIDDTTGEVRLRPRPDR